MTKRAGMPEPGKPFTEMTRDELAEWRNAVRRWQRDRDVAAGRRAPRTMREMDLWQTAADRHLTGRRRVRGVRPVDGDEPDGDDAA